MLRVDADMPLIMSSHATIRPSCRLCDDRLDPCAVGTFGTRDTSIALYAYMVKHLPNMGPKQICLLLRYYHTPLLNQVYNMLFGKSFIACLTPKSPKISSVPPRIASNL